MHTEWEVKPEIKETLATVKGTKGGKGKSQNRSRLVDCMFVEETGSRVAHPGGG